MKILTNKQVDIILRRITACQIIANNYIKDIQANTKMTENLAEICTEIGRFKEVQKVLNTIDKYGVGEIDGVD